MGEEIHLRNVYFVFLSREALNKALLPARAHARIFAADKIVSIKLLTGRLSLM
jgi:hypothetical protein